jgi:hypothetical protein
MKTLGIITANYKRPKILELWCASIKRIGEELGMYIPTVCISGIEDTMTCVKYGITHIPQENHPVSEKFNRGMEFAKDLGWDYTMILGSDDICSTDTIRKIMEEMEKGFQVIGMDNIYFYGADSPHKGKLVHLQGTRLLGVGKTIRSDVLDKVDWRPWPKKVYKAGQLATGKDWGLDALVTQCIAPHANSYSILSDTIIVDCKSKDSMNFMSLWVKKLPLVDPQVFYNILGEEEKQILAQI